MTLSWVSQLYTTELGIRRGDYSLIYCCSVSQAAQTTVYFCEKVTWTSENAKGFFKQWLAGNTSSSIAFETLSGDLIVKRKGNSISMDFPVGKIEKKVNLLLYAILLYAKKNFALDQKNHHYHHVIKLVLRV